MEAVSHLRPYKGKQPYIFISYAHKNSDEALAIIRTLQDHGYRVWFDEGIDPGTEWDDNISMYVENCRFFVALLSEEYLESPNCKDELKYARDCEKAQLLIYLSNVPLTGGIKLRLGRLQAIHKYRYADEEGFWEKVLETPGIASCLAMATDNKGVLEGLEGKDSLSSGEPADTEPLLEPSADQPRAEPEKITPAHPSDTEPSPLNPNEAGQTAADENEDDFDADFADALSKTIKTLSISELVTGVVTEISATEVVVDIGTAHTAFIPRDEWSFDYAFDATISLASQVKIGDRVTAAVVRVNDIDGVAVLSRKAVEKQNAWVSIIKAEEDHSLLDGIITEVNEYGVVASIGGVRVFIPASQSGKLRGSDLSDMMKTCVQLRITEVDRARRRVVGSIRAAVAEQRTAAANQVWVNIEVGKHYTGTVKSLAAYGAFVDIGGVDGIVHISELSWSRIKDPAEVVSVGDQVDVYVISFDREKKRISLSMKDRTQEPWAAFLSKYSVGDVVTVRIVKLMTLGAFAEIIPGVDGLIHISQLSNHQVEKPGDVVSEGDTVDAKIIAIDNENKKVSLSIRALLEAPVPIEDDKDGVPVNSETEAIE